MKKGDGVIDICYNIQVAVVCNNQIVAAIDVRKEDSFLINS
jgi:hypothetical protein